MGESAKRIEPPIERKRASALLLDLCRAWPADRIAIGDLMTALGDRGYGLLMLTLALPNLIPAPIPGLSGVLGTPIIILAAMMLVGYPQPVLPRAIRERTMPRAAMEAVLPEYLWRFRPTGPASRGIAPTTAGAVRRTADSAARRSGTRNACESFRGSSGQAPGFTAMSRMARSRGLRYSCRVEAMPASVTS